MGAQATLEWTPSDSGERQFETTMEQPMALILLKSRRSILRRDEVSLSNLTWLAFPLCRMHQQQHCQLSQAASGNGSVPEECLSAYRG